MRALEFIRDHVTFKLPYDFSYQMKKPQAGILPKWFSNRGIILEKGQFDHSCSFWTMLILIFIPVKIILRHPLCDELFNNLIFSLIANVQPNRTLPCLVHATRLQNVQTRAVQQMETVLQDLELVALLRKFSQCCYIWKIDFLGTSGNSAPRWFLLVSFPADLLLWL